MHQLSCGEIIGANDAVNLATLTASYITI